MKIKGQIRSWLFRNHDESIDVRVVSQSVIHAARFRSQLLSHQVTWAKSFATIFLHDKIIWKLPSQDLSGRQELAHLRNCANTTWRLADAIPRTSC